MPKRKKIVSSTPNPLIVRGYANFTKTMYYALLGIITETISDIEKDKNEKKAKDPHYVPKPDKLNDPKIAEDIYNKIGKLYPLSTFNVVILNLVGGNYQFSTSKETTAYLSVSSGNKVFTIFKYKD